MSTDISWAVGKLLFYVIILLLTNFFRYQPELLTMTQGDRRTMMTTGMETMMKQGQGHEATMLQTWDNSGKDQKRAVGMRDEDGRDRTD
jgi:hypothetical protein